MINILIVEKQSLFCEGIEALVTSEPDMTLMGTFTDETDIRTALKHEIPDVVLMNIEIDSFDGIKLTIYLKEHYPVTKVIHYSSKIDERKVIKGIIEGADAILLQSIDGTNLIHTIRDVSKGQYIFSGEVARVLAKKVVEMKTDNRVMLKRKFEHRDIHVTNRELDVAYLLRENLTNPKIAEQLQLHEGTVKNYVSSLYEKLDFADRQEMVHFINSLLEKKVYS